MVMTVRTCFIMAGMQDQGVREGSNSSAVELPHCCCDPVDAPLHGNLQPCTCNTQHRTRGTKSTINSSLGHSGSC